MVDVVMPEPLRGSYAMAYLQMDAGEQVVTERGAMVACSAGVATGYTTGGGLVAATIRRFAGHESLLMAAWTAQTTGAWVAVAPPYPGDLAVVDPGAGGPVLLSAGAFVASCATVQLDTVVAGPAAVLAREGVTMLRVSGAGPVVAGSYGAVVPTVLQPGQPLVVDTGHLVGWHEDLDVTVGPLGSLVTAAATGEHLVAKFTNPTRHDRTVWIQTRAELGLRSWLFPNAQDGPAGRKGR